MSGKESLVELRIALKQLEAQAGELHKALWLIAERIEKVREEIKELESLE